ncbi:16S rRNA processing protein RimM [bacterium]|nr:16S rRNA processing protein RimM [bacterium]
MRIGKVGAVHGVHGEVKVFSLTDVPDRFETLKTIWWIGKKQNSKRLTVATFRPGERFHLIRFEEIARREEASQLSNGFLALPRSERGILSTGRYFIDDIIDLQVEDAQGNSIGKVTDVIQTGSNDIYEIHNAANKELLLPAVKDIILSIDLQNKRMRVRIPEGF